MPPQLEWIRREPTGPEWLDGLEKLVARLADEWELQVGECFSGGNVSFVAPARRRDGTDAVLKVQWPSRESESEADALRAWNGDGAVLLLEHDAPRHALLVERCSPGSHLGEDHTVDGVGVMIDLLPRLWVDPPESVGTLSDEAARLASTLVANWDRAGQPCDRRLVDAAVHALTDVSDLTADQGEAVLLHQDLHGGNVLAAEREPWLVIDPKPLAGTREFAIAPIVRSIELGWGRHAVLGRFDRLTAELGLERERARAWTIGQSVAWGLGHPHILQAAQWLLDP